jgi:hypothetical protein
MALDILPYKLRAVIMRRNNSLRYNSSLQKAIPPSLHTYAIIAIRAPRLTRFCLVDLHQLLRAQNLYQQIDLLAISSRFRPVKIVVKPNSSTVKTHCRAYLDFQKFSLLAIACV